MSERFELRHKGGGHTKGIKIASGEWVVITRLTHGLDHRRLMEKAQLFGFLLDNGIPFEDAKRIAEVDE